jgi:hypothetical protein
VITAVVSERISGTQEGSRPTRVAAAPEERKNESAVIHFFCVV